MKFIIEELYPEKWITPNEQEAPFPECERIPWETESMQGADWAIEVKSLEDLLDLARHKGANIFIKVNQPTDLSCITLTNQDELE